MQEGAIVHFKRPGGGCTVTKSRLRMKYALSLMVLVVLAAPYRSISAQSPGPAATRQKIILDTDIGDDIDDAFALGLALSSPELQLLGVTSAWGNTDLRARLAARLLAQTGHSEIPVTAGPTTSASSVFSQGRCASDFPGTAHGWPDASDCLLDAIRHDPAQITLVSIAPLT